MPFKNHKATRADYSHILQYIINSLRDSGLGSEVDFLVYGSYFGTWKEGLSDLDGMLFFRKRSPIDASLREAVKYFQTSIRVLYESFEFLEMGSLADLFVIDGFHATDGRFMVFDADWLSDRNTRQEDHAFVHGENFIPQLFPVSLRYENEFELALGLSRLRNYWLFEIPRRSSQISFEYSKGVLKYLKVLPLKISTILREPLIRTPDKIHNLRNYFRDINYDPLIRLYKATSGHDDIRRYLLEMHDFERGDNRFLDCLECFEATLNLIVKNEPMRSSK